MPATSSTSSSDRRLLWLVRLAGLLAGAVFLAIRIPACGGALTQGRDALGGDLYQMARVEDFREPMPGESITPVVYGAPAESAQVVLIGDSHTRFARGGKSLASRLHERFPQLRSCAASVIHPRFFDPSDLLRLQRIRPGQVKLVVWESTERYLPDIALYRIPLPSHGWDTTARFDRFLQARDFSARWFTGSEAGYQYLLLNSRPTRGLMERWNTLRFHLAGELPSSIGAWTRSPARLFMDEEVTSAPLPAGRAPTSFRQPRDSLLAEAVAASLAEARDRLRRDFGAELVVVAVPAKGSLAHASLGYAYDGFLPRVDRALGRRGIRAVDTWNALSGLGDGALLRSETHLSPASYSLLSDSIAQAIGEAVPELRGR